ncbi:metallophosphoesterase [Frateuria sp. Soil773]|uniref:metallophosphoesterase family protein n=1 Tax=Frateuria sp. Soil773 TaxID=1736407 RepID=UPI0006F60E3B|nr:metallophosphoesterase family protein [Frateuria sp. Soil773]KRE89518.1 metallophosphoesterase [Frateuria sp. Soil773]
MRIAVLSDIHGNLAALDAVLADLARRGCDLAVNLGDLLSGPLFPAETAERLMALDLPTIRGNHERQLLEQPPERMGASDAYARACLDEVQLDWLRALPAELRLNEAVHLCHGTPGSDLDYFLEDVDAGGCRPAAAERVHARAGAVDAELILCGHTHTPRAVRLDDGRLVVNPGSVGLQAYAWDRPRPHAVETGTPHARYAIVERGARGWSVESIALAYDWEAAARAADARGRPEWAHALRHGRMPASSQEHP